MSQRLEPGDIAPEFVLPTVSGTVSLDGLLEQAEAGVIVYFYPRAATPGCTTQACDFQDSYAALKSAGYRLVGISPDPVDKLEAFAETESLGFPLASDPDKTTLEAYGAYGEKKNYGKVVKGVIRSTIIISPDGTVAHALYNVKATGHVARIEKLLGITQG
ncbi:peroxiredoxin [Bowdeniella nasicola]|uniref:thioredoxin-dependent peroxiredoxin n=1 Tax=Bowdeniella nasicola TaxID=208480 RepID=A0A1Q5Q402_9ACTO|nr:peroxiredoxin [Bowdeniella nasicola]OKL54370.1 peroxiredoxin [Bowdeniella nasicola]